MMFVSFIKNSNTTGATIGVGTTHPSGTHESHWYFYRPRRDVLDTTLCDDKVVYHIFISNNVNFAHT